MRQLVIDGFYAWSRFSPEKQMDFNAHVWVRPEGNVVIDPVALDDNDKKHLEELGGVSLCVITNADHKRAVAELREAFEFDVVCHKNDADAIGVEVARRLEDDEEILPGMIAMHMPHGKTPGEIALLFPDVLTVLFGDIIQGAPAGALQMLPDEKLADPARAALALRRLLPLPFRNILVGDGCSLWGAARQALHDCLSRRRDIDAYRVNLEELPWADTSADERYQHDIREISKVIGAQQLGYNVRRLAPGQVSGPMHFHRNQEEFFMVLSGSCTLERPEQTVELREGDFVACLSGERGTHTLSNKGSESCTVLCVSNLMANDERELVGLREFRADLINP